MNELIRMNYYLVSGIALLLGTLPYIRKTLFRNKVRYSLKHAKRHIILFMSGLDLILAHIILNLLGLMSEYSKNSFYYFFILIILLKSIFVTYGIMNVMDSDQT
jgi:hypothetical protein